jgi:hypothetical protein
MNQSSTAKGNLLRNVLRANGVFSLVSGGIALLDASALAEFFAVGDSLLYIGVGAILILHAAILFYFTRTEKVSRFLAWYAIEGDVAWVLASLVIIFTGAFGISEGGKWALFILSDAVLVFAVLQYLGLRKMQR